jgi:DNA-binding NtrC family response regulator
VNSILILEDEPVIRQALKRLLERHQYRVQEAGSLEEAMQTQGLGGFDLIIADLRLPGASGIDVIPLCDGTPVLIMTSYSSVPSAVDAMRRGAADYIAKPFDYDELLIVVRRILNERRTARQNEALKSDLQQQYPVAGMVDNCPQMQAVATTIRKVAPTDATVLVLGESGTGKELVARALHEQSSRRDGPMIAVNCASIPEGLIESELFGHEKGAFTGAFGARRGMVEAASGGTLFLDEIGELPPGAQAQLLRVLQDGEVRRVGATRTRHVSVRLIAATHRDLKQLVRRQQFREDLYFRLHVVEIRLPPLRERGEDVLALAAYFLSRSCAQLNRSSAGFTPAALRLIRQHQWPGNIRELKNAIERAVILAESEEITPELLALDAETPARNAPASVPTLSMDEYFRCFVLANEDRLTETEMAQQLGISRKSLWERRKRLGIARKS